MATKRSKKKAPGHAIPLPEAIDGRRWNVHRSPTTRLAGITRTRGAATDTMIVPMGAFEQERLIRAHEMIHVSITPDDYEMRVRAADLPDPIVQLCEDARVHGQMRRLEFDPAAMEGIIHDNELKQMAEKAHPAELAGIGAALFATGEAQRLEAAIANLPETVQEERMAIFTYGLHMANNWMHPGMQESLPPFDEVLDMARAIVELLGDPDDPPQDTPEGQEGLEQIPEITPWQMPQLAQKPIEKKKGPTNDDPHGENLVWANMIIEEPPLPLTLPGKMRGKRRKVPEQRGRRLHRIGRLHHDGRVFSHKPPLRGGGAVLIDTSGSMSLSNEEVIQLCATYPAGIIGAYCSDHGDTVGTLRIIARRGRRVTDEMINPEGGGNGVDGPALDWLAKQPGPRFWISDAGVSGGPEGLRYCLNVCRKNAIKRVDNAWQIVGRDVG